MNSSDFPGDLLIASYTSALGLGWKDRPVPASVAGDLSDLRMTMERCLQTLRELASAESGGAVREKALELEVVLGDEIRAIADDLIPSLRELRHGR